MSGRVAWFVLAVLGPVAAASAGQQSLPLAPPSAEIALRAYAMRLLPIDGVFSRFHGAITFDPDRRGECSVDVTVEAASLTGPRDSIRDDIVSPLFLDAPAFPTFRYRGACRGGGVIGELTLRGETHPLALSIAEQAKKLVATGVIRRAEWGMTARPFMVGPDVRIQFSVPLSDPLRQVMPSVGGERSN